jgi:hypothetical protein
MINSTMKSKAVLHAHPYFYGPTAGRKRGIDEIAYAFMFRPPSLRDIADHSITHGIGICAISACHTSTGGMDNRWDFYISQLGQLGNKYKVEESHLDEGWIHLRKGQEQLILVHSQEVRTSHEGMPADINVIGVKGLIPHSLAIDETVKIGREEGGLVTVCHGNSAYCSAGIDKTIALVKSGQVHTAEGFNATESPEVNKQLMDRLTREKINWIAVPDSHHYTQNNAAGLYVTPEIVANFSREGLISCVTSGDFKNYTGQIGRASRFMTHELPILMSIPGHLIHRPRQIINVLTRRYKK